MPLRAKSGTPLTWRDWYSGHRFGILLLILLSLIAGSQVLVGYGLFLQWFDGVMALLTFVAIIPLCFERLERIYALTSGIPTIAFYATGHLLTGNASDRMNLLGDLCGLLFLWGASFLIVKSLLVNRLPSADTIFGTVCGYLYLGLGWAVAYSIIEEFDPGSFEFQEAIAATPTMRRTSVHGLVYFSFITLTTVGFGDVTPVSPLTRTLAWLEAMSGQFYLAVIVAGLVSMLSTRILGRHPPGPTPD